MQQKHWNCKTACFDVSICIFFLLYFLFKGKSDGSEEEKGEEVVNKPVRTMPKKSRNPFLSEKYV